MVVHKKREEPLATYRFVNYLCNGVRGLRVWPLTNTLQATKSARPLSRALTTSLQVCLYVREKRLWSVCMFGVLTPGNQSGQTNIWMSWPSLAETASLWDIRTKHSSGYKFSVLEKNILGCLLHVNVWCEFDPVITGKGRALASITEK